jgi:hypothetical protein
MNKLWYVAAAFAALSAKTAFSQPQPTGVLAPHTARPEKKMRQFVYLGQDELRENLPILDRPDIAGAEVIYVWMNLEPTKDGYDFAIVEEDLALAKARGKELYVEIGDRFFRPNTRYLPKYILNDPEYGGGLARQAEPWIRAG